MQCLFTAFFVRITKFCINYLEFCKGIALMAKIFSNFLQVNKVEPMDFPKMYEMLKEIYKFWTERRLRNIGLNKYFGPRGDSGI